MRFGLSDSIWQSMQAVFEATPGIQKVLIFGSRARGENDPSSDIDLALIAPDLAPDAFTRLWHELDELPLIYKLDIVWMEQLSDEVLKTMILRDGKEIYP